MSDEITPIAGPGLKGEVAVIEPDRGERTVARRSAESRATIPTLELSAVAEVDRILARERELGCGVPSLVIAATANALRAVPRVNGSYRDGRYELYSRVNIGVTIVDAGIYATPTIFDADQRTPGEISDELANFTARVRGGEELRPAELTGATFTVVSASTYDIVSVAPMILAPQAGALSFGPVRDTPVVRDGAVVAGHTMALELAVDHRIVYGDHAASFLEEVKAWLEETQK